MGSASEENVKWREDMENLRAGYTAVEEEARSKSEECVVLKNEYDVLVEQHNDLEQLNNITNVEKQTWKDQYQNSQLLICEKEEELAKKEDDILQKQEYIAKKEEDITKKEEEVSKAR